MVNQGSEAERPRPEVTQVSGFKFQVSPPVYRDGPEGKTYAKKFQIGGLSRDKLYPLAKTEGSKLVWLHVADKEKDMPKAIHVSLDGRSGARVRELDFDLTAIPVSTRTSKGLIVTK